MRRLTTPVLALAALSVAGAGCGTVAASTPRSQSRPAPPAVRLDLSSNGKTFHAALGELVVVSLPSIGDGGYVWLPKTLDGLKVDSHKYVPPKSGASGAAGTDVYVLAASTPGTDHLLLVAGRPWQGAGVGELFKATVVVS
jgi:predicted secreted protein